MRLTSIITLCTLAMGLTLIDLPCAAATATGDEGEARTAFLRAQAHHGEGRYGEAVLELKRAYALKPIGVLLRYIADCYDSLKKYKLALEYYRRYLDRSPHAGDKVKIGLRVRELESFLSADEEEYGVPVGTRRKLPGTLVADGRDREVPLELRASASAEPSDAGRLLPALKWSALGAGLLGLAAGITYAVLARGKADELRRAVRSGCPEESPGCGGNPGLDRPVMPFSQAQYDLERAHSRYQNRATGFLVAGGVAGAASVILFVVDRWRSGPARQERRLSVVPVLGESCGVSGEVSF